MSSIRDHSRTLAKSLLEVLVVSLLVVTVAGCGDSARPVSGADVSPIQLKSQAKRTQPAPTQADAAKPMPASPAAQQPSPAAAPVAKAKPPQELPHAAPTAQPEARVLQAPPAQPVQTPPPQNAAIPAADQPEPVVQAPQPAVRDVDMPRLKDPARADEPVSVNFENVDIRTVLKTVGDITGINFIPHQSVTGTVTVMSPTPIRLGDLYAFLQSILDVYGYAAVETDNAVKIVPRAEAARNSVRVRIGADPAFIPRNDAIVTQIMPLKYADAGEVSQIIEPVLATGAQMATYPRTNSIMITDTSANIHHVAQIISRLDVEGSREKIQLVPLTHASARSASELIMGILEKTRPALAQAGRARPGQQSPGDGPSVLPDERTNSLIVIAGEQDIERVTQLARQLDIERPLGANNVHVVYLKNGDANEVAPSLKAALATMKLTGQAEAAQQIEITPNASTNSLIVVATPQDFEVISDIINQLDIVREQVFVEMQIIEVTEEALQEIGVDWATLDQAVTDSVRGFGMTNLGPRLASPLTGGTGEGLFMGAWKGDNIGVILQALKKESVLNILSTPQIMTTNHRRARIIVGENRPFVKESQITRSPTPTLDATVIQGFEYKDVGITLEITPHVSQGGMIRMEINSEFTKLIDDVATQSLNTPVTAKRTAQTVVTMSSGATVVIGGLIRDDKTRVTKKIPLLGDLPLVGALFSDQKDQTQKTDLLMFVTPHVMKSQEQMQELTDAKRDQMAPALEGGK